MMSPDINPSSPFDLIVLTAANEAQRQGYDDQLQWRREAHRLPDSQFRVICDPLGKRIGSGGSTFYVLETLHKEFGESLFDKRILLLHSGGDSRRLPAYSAVGKIFAPLPTRDHYALFDVMLENYSALPGQEGGQVIITSGDVLLNFNPAFVRFAPRGITGVAYPEHPQAGEHFGVYVVDDVQKGVVPARDVLQKPDPDTLQKNDAVDRANRIWIDTGIVNLAPDAVRTVLKCKGLLDEFRNGSLNLNFYHEILYAVVGKMNLKDSPLLNQLDLQVNCLPYCGFYHVGRSRELLNNFYSLTHASALYEFENSTRSNAFRFPECKSAWIYNSVVDSTALSISEPCLIEGCFVPKQLTLKGDNILTGLPPGVPSVELAKGYCLHVLPIENGWVAILYGLDDQFKGEGTWLNLPLVEKLNSLGITESIRDVEEHDIWNARLFPWATEAAEAVDIALSLQEGSTSETWQRARRFSMSDILTSVNHQRLNRHHRDLERAFLLATLPERLEEDMSLGTILDDINPDQREQALRHLDDGLEAETSPLQRARLAYWRGRLSKDDAEPFYGQAFQAIRDAVGLGLGDGIPLLPDPRISIRSDQVVWTLLPARLDFAGGWTDTPPICLERGGRVINASVKLNGQYPIQVVGKVRPDDYRIGVTSIDLGQRKMISSMGELQDYRNPADWLSLPKAAFFAAGLVDVHREENLEELLRRMGGGLDLTLFSALPAGSGLGTSSIPVSYTHLTLPTN